MRERDVGHLVTTGKPTSALAVSNMIDACRHGEHRRAVISLSLPLYCSIDWAWQHDHLAIAAVSEKQ
ncbi:hypothetical protein NL676_038353 [Syzygium grande]|nr:hypothetical protein NL676_038353 [Syzygium grande]